VLHHGLALLSRGGLMAGSGIFLGLVMVFYADFRSRVALMCLYDRPVYPLHIDADVGLVLCSARLAIGIR
jgi:hypothetical protein